MKNLFRSVALACGLTLLPGILSTATAQTVYGTTGTYTYNVTMSGTYTITTSGADGGDTWGDGLKGGAGASMVATFNLTAGSTLTVFVGDNGQDGFVDVRAGGGGGGGSAVILNGASVLIAAAGGGGGSRFQTGFGGLANTNSSAIAGVSTYGGGGGAFNATAGDATLGCLSTQGGRQGTLTTIGAAALGFNPNSCDQSGGDGGQGFGGGGGANAQSGGGGGGYKGGDGSNTNGVGGQGGDSYVNTGVASGTVVSATAGADGGSISGDKDGSVTIKAPGGSLYMAQSAASIFDHSSDNIADIGLDYSGTGLRGLQSTLEINSPNLQVTSVTRGPAISDASRWTLDYQITNGVTGSSIEIILYGKTNADFLATGSYAQLFVLHYDVPDLKLCDGALGGDQTTGVMTLTAISSSNNDGMASPAGITIDASRKIETMTINNTSGRGDVDCNDRVDVLDLGKTINVLAKRTTFSDWQKNRADMAPWSSQWAVPGTIFSDANNYGNSTVDVSDVVVMADAILNAKWPDNKALYRARGASGKSLIGKSNVDDVIDYDVMITCVTGIDGIDVMMENSKPVSSLQFDLHVSDAPAAIQAKLASQLAGRFEVRVGRIGDALRVILFSLNGMMILPMNGRLLELPMAYSDPASVEIVGAVIAGDVESNPLVAEHVVLGRVHRAATTGGDEMTRMTMAPNPARETTTLSFDLPTAQSVTVRLVDARGAEALRAIEHAGAKGSNQVILSTDGLATGTYRCVVTGEGGEWSRPLVVAR